MVQNQNQQEKYLTQYQIIALEFGVTPRFVGMIARKERNPKRGTGLLVKQKLDSINTEKL